MLHLRFLETDDRIWLFLSIFGNSNEEGDFLLILMGKATLGGDVEIALLGGWNNVRRLHKSELPHAYHQRLICCANFNNKYLNICLKYSNNKYMFRMFK